MLVREIMTSPCRSCRRDTNLAEVAREMWDGDCGILPIVDDGGVVVGVVTDRDICIAAATDSRWPAHIGAGEMVRGPVLTAAPDEEVREALRRMGAGRVRRLPVVDGEGRLVGILSLNDAARAAGDEPDREVADAEVLAAWKAICQPRT